MKRPKRWGALLVALPLLLVAGCSDDDDGDMMDGVDATQAAAAVGATMNSIAAPLITVIQNLSLVIPRQRGVPTCDDPVPCPFGGTVQVCPTSIEFDVCDAGAVIDGSIDSVDIISGTGVFNLTIDETQLLGPGLVGGDVCGKGEGGALILDAVSAVFDGNMARVDSNMQVCDGLPTGTMTITTDLLQIVLSFDGTTTVVGVATDLSSGQVIVSCTGDLSQSPIEPDCS